MPRSQRGAVMSEVAIALPLLFLLAFGMIELGRVLTAVSWSSHTSYNVALAGSNTPGNNVEARSAERSQMLERLILDSCSNPQGRVPRECTVSLAGGFDGGQYSQILEHSSGNILRVAHHGSIREMGFLLGDFGFTTSIAVPLLHSTIQFPNPDAFGNPSTEYCSSGELCVGTGQIPQDPGGGADYEVFRSVRSVRESSTFYEPTDYALTEHEEFIP